MKIAVVKAESDKHYTKGIIRALDDRKIDYGFVDPKDSDIVNIAKTYDAFVWHFSHAIALDYLISKPLIKALEVSGLTVFPPTIDTWHFDDKIAQKYLFEALDLPSATTKIFFDVRSAMNELTKQDGHMVMKLRSGASSANVRLISNDLRGRRLVRRAFGRGFRQFDRIGMARDAWKTAQIFNLSRVFHACTETLKIFSRSQYEKVRGSEKHYLLLQKFLPENNFDVRLVVIDGKAFGMRRFNREGDFRASGSGSFDYSPEEIPDSCVKLALDTAKRLRSTAIAFDFLFDKGTPNLIEISYGVNSAGYRGCQGYWNSDGQWTPSPWPQGDFQFENFIVEALLKAIKKKKESR